MPRFEPFSGLRYDPSRVRLADVVAPPYDVIAPAERIALAAQSPFNSVRIDLPDAEGALDPYAAAARRLADWQDAGILRRDAAPVFYGYRVTYPDGAGRTRQSIGVIGALGLEPPGTSGIFPHERTTPKAKSDRLHLLQTTKINTSPIWGLSLAAGLSDALNRTSRREHDDRTETVVDADGIQHDVWPITDSAAIAQIASMVSGAPIVIADGHHRFETALAYQAEQRLTATGTQEPYDAVMALVVELIDDQLTVQGIHRLISGLPADYDLVKAFTEHYELTPSGPADAAILQRMEANAAAALITPDGAWLLRPVPDTIAATSQDLDSSRLEVALATLPDHEIAYQHGWDLAVNAVQRGDVQAAVLLRPVTVEQIASTGRGGERMPPKTTFFWPKPKTGFVFREVGA